MKKMYISILFIFSLSLNAEPFVRNLSLENPRMNGNDVIALQEVLLELGFTDAASENGKYGQLTETAVRKLQHLLGVTINGKVNRFVWNLIMDTSIDEELISAIQDMNKISGMELSRTEVTLFGYSAEGATIDIYKTGDAILRVESKFLGEYSRNESETYFLPNNKIILLETIYNYDGFFGVENATIEYKCKYSNLYKSYEIIEGELIEKEIDLVGILRIINDYYIENNISN